MNNKFRLIVIGILILIVIIAAYRAITKTGGLSADINNQTNQLKK